MDPRLSEAAQVGDVCALGELLKEDPLILEKLALSSSLQNPLHIASLAGRPAFVQEIATLKPSFAKERNEDGFTPLHIASATGNIEVVRELLKVGPELCMLKDKEGRTPLHWAAMKGRVAVIEELMSVCPEAIKEQTARGDTALNLAANNNQFEALKLMVEKLDDDGVDSDPLNAKNGDGKSILQAAVTSKQPQVVDFLSSQSKVGKETIEVLSGERHEAANDLASVVSQTEKSLTKPNSTKSRESDQSSQNNFDSIWSEVEEMVLVVASLIVTVTYQAGLSPPQTIWKDSMKLDKRCISHHLFFSSTNFCPIASYYLFMSFNTSGFFSAVFLIFFFRKPSYVQVLLPLSLISMMITYITLSVSMSPNGLSLLVIYVATLAIFLYCILAVQVVKTMLHSAVRIAAGKVSNMTKAMIKKKSSTASASKVLGKKFGSILSRNV